MKGKVKKYAKKVFWNILRLFFFPFIKMDDKLMLFGTAIEKFADNPKYLFLYVANNEKDFKPVWITNNEEVLRNLRKANYVAVKRDSFKAFFLTMKAKFFFFSHNIDDIFYFRRKNTIAVNLWHGSPLKSIGFNSESELRWIRRRKRLGLKLPYEMWDYLVVAHERWIPYFESSMKISNRKILPMGLPRNDILWEVKKNQDLLLKLKERILSYVGAKDITSKIILYAPTFRDNKNLAFKLKKEVKVLVKKIESLLKTVNYILLLRFHPMDSKEFKEIILNSDYVFDVTEYEDIQELLAITHILISDYSSCIFDFTILERPIILYMPDIREYCKVRGGLYNVLYTSCFLIFEDRDELLSCLESIILDGSSTPLSKCSGKYNIYGSASKKLITMLASEKP